MDPSIVKGEMWNEFCEALKRAGHTILDNNSPSDSLNRAEGFRYLSRLMRIALGAYVENNDPNLPVLRRVVHETAKLGADNPDNYYMHATISGAYNYRITGHRGTVHYLGFGTQIGNYGQSRGMPPTGYLEAKELDIAEDGTFELILSSQEQSGNWLPMSEQTGTLIVRQTFLDRENEELASLKIERIGHKGNPTPFEPGAFADGLKTSTNLIQGATMLFSSWVEGFKAHKNELPRFDQNLSNLVGGDPNIAYYHSYWELEPDEALVIEVTPPECDHWNFQLNNYWMESLDYRHYGVHLNKHSAKYREDGSLQVVVAKEDRGFDNWINTVDHPCGTMCWRWVRAKENPQPQTRVVKLDALSG